MGTSSALKRHSSQSACEQLYPQKLGVLGSKGSLLESYISPLITVYQMFELDGSCASKKVHIFVQASPYKRLQKCSVHI